MTTIMTTIRSILRKGAIRWLLITMLLLTLTAGGVWAYKALTATGDITITECLSFVGDSTFTVNLYPQESDTATITVANSSGFDMEVDLVSTVLPDPGTKGLTVDIPSKITVPAAGEVAVSISITAGKNVVPDSYTVSIDFER